MIFGEQERGRIRLGLVEIQLQIAAGAITVRRVGFPENQNGVFIWQGYLQLFDQHLYGQQIILVIQQDDAAVGIGGPGGDNIAGSVAAIILEHGFAELKVQAGKRIAVLIDLVDAAFRHIDQIVFQGHV